jgi:isocitrate dehydrogenase
MATGKSKIIYTLTDEAPLLATCAFLPIIRTFTGPAGIEIEKADISVSARVLAEFSECLSDEQKVPNTLANWARKCLEPDVNIIKLPNISASVAQLKACVKELQAKGYPIPDYPESPSTDEEKAIVTRYGKCLGSAVNPVLREGNSDRRAPLAVKNYARKNPHSMGEWKPWSRTHVSHMHHGDFYHGEKSLTLDKARNVRMELIAKGGKITVLKPKLALLEGEIIDSMFMSKKALCDFYERELEDCRESGILFSLHVKATMMKVSHPIVFGHCVRIFYKEAFEKHEALFSELGINVNNGMVDLYEKIKTLPESKRDEIIRDLHACQEHRPKLAMVDSAKGITNFHSPNDIIVDASMPAMIRSGRQDVGRRRQAVRQQVRDAGIDLRPHLPGDDQLLQDQRQLRSEDHGHRAQRRSDGPEGRRIRLPRQDLRNRRRRHRQHRRHRHRRSAAHPERRSRRHLAHVPGQGCPDPRLGQAGRHPCPQLRHAGRLLAGPLPSARSELIKKVQTYLKDHDTTGLEIHIMSQVRAMRFTLERVIRGLDTISVTGNILRDYLTDLFPIMELGTSAKMLSIVPLMAGGGMYETGAGGSAPKHVQQLTEENHLRWDSLGEFLALAVSLEDLGIKKATSAPFCSPRPSTQPPASCSTTASRRRPRPASSTTAAPSSTWPCTGPRNWPTRPRTPNWPPTSPSWPSPDRQRSADRCRT